VAVPDAIYTDPRLAAVYEVLNPPAADTAFYLALAGETSLDVLDMGCGTGALAVEAARRGHRVWGADPAEAMLAIARARPGGDHVTWVRSDAAGLRLDTRFDLIIMTGHVFQVFLEDEAVRAALASLHAHLAPGGRLAFETRNPAVRAWRTWTPKETFQAVEVPDLGRVEVWHDLRTAEDGRVTFDTHFHFADSSAAVEPSTLRFMDRDELAGFLAEAGLMEIAWFGDWDSAPLGLASPEIIAVAASPHFSN
jgi:SAM-dependent methyltransferase